METRHEDRRRNQVRVQAALQRDPEVDSRDASTWSFAPHRSFRPIQAEWVAFALHVFAERATRSRQLLALAPQALFDQPVESVFHWAGFRRPDSAC